MCGGNGITHVDQPPFGHQFAMPVFIFGKMQIFNGLVGQAGIVKFRDGVLRKEVQGLFLLG